MSRGWGSCAWYYRWHIIFCRGFYKNQNRPSMAGQCQRDHGSGPTHVLLFFHLLPLCGLHTFRRDRAAQVYNRNSQSSWSLWWSSYSMISTRGFSRYSIPGSISLETIVHDGRVAVIVRMMKKVFNGLFCIFIDIYCWWLGTMSYS